MSQYKILPSQVLIVPGYTNEEIIAMSAKTNKTSASALKNGTSSTDKTKKDNDKTTSSSDKTLLDSSSSQTKTRMLKSRKGATTKKVNEAQLAKSQAKLKQNVAIWNSLSSLWKSSSKTSANDAPSNYMVSSYSSSADYYNYIYRENIRKRNQEVISKKNKSTTSNSKKNKTQSSTKNTSKTKTTKKTSKASKKIKTTSKKTDSSKTKSNTNKSSNVNESSGATATESTIKIEKPKALLFSPNTVDYTAHKPDYEEFNGADGLILIEKACDQFAELQLTLSVHQAMRIQENGTLELSADDKRSIDIITSGAPTALDTETELGRFLNPEDFTDSFIEIRRSFFDNYKNRPLTLISDLFPIIPVCYITDLDYNINEGEEQAEYSITFREVANTWG